LGGDSIGNCEKKAVHMMGMCLILIGYRDGAFLNPISRSKSVVFLFVGLDEERSLLTEGGYTKRTAGLHFGCCWLHKDT